MVPSSSFKSRFSSCSVSRNNTIVPSSSKAKAPCTICRFIWSKRRYISPGFPGTGMIICSQIKMGSSQSMTKFLIPRSSSSTTTRPSASSSLTMESLRSSTYPLTSTKSAIALSLYDTPYAILVHSLT